MKLSPRERWTALVAGSVLLIVGGSYGLYTIINSLATFQERVDDWKQTNSKLERVKRQGRNASRRLVGYAGRSLPSDPSKARTIYLQWLLETVEKHFVDPNLSGPSESRNRNVYHQFSYIVKTRGKLDQLTAFLYDFYSIDVLHRISSLTVQPVKDSKDLDVVFVVEALSLTRADENQSLNTTPVNQREGAVQRLRYEELDVASYVDPILDRNLFGTANQPPKIASIDSQGATPQRRHTISLKATDSDELDRISFKLGDDVPEGVTLESEKDGAASIRWTPPKVGTYDFSVTVMDDGLPQRSESRTFQVVVKDPPPPPPPRTEPTKPKFDVAGFTILTAVLQDRDGQKVVWLDEKPTGKLHRSLGIGDQFNIGSVTGVIREIGVKDMVFESEGQRLRMTKGENLLAAKRISAEDS